MKSVRTQLVFWNILSLALLLGALGGVIHYTVVHTIYTSIDRDLAHRVAPHGPDGHGPDGPPPGPPGSSPGFGSAIGGRSGPPPGGSFRFGGPDGDRGGPPPGQPFGGDHPPGGPNHGPDSDPYHPRFFDLQGRSHNPNGTEVVWDPIGFQNATHGQAYTATVTVDGTSLRVLSQPIPSHGAPRGVIQVAYPLTDTERAIAGLNRALLTLIPVALLGAGLGGTFLTNRVLRRVRRMTQAAGKISARDLSERLPAAGDDEFSALAVTFNGLLGRLEDAFSQQGRLLEQQRRFTADASHELKTPLTVIKGNAGIALADLAGEESPMAERCRQSMQEIDMAAGSMSRLVQDLLLLARADSGQLGKNRIELLVSDVLSQARARALSKTNAPICMEILPEMLSVRGNEEELVRLFSNLLDNAVRYTPPDGNVDVVANRMGTRVIITVADTGTGISPEQLAHLGERFYRADDSRARPSGGTGLGLSICRSIVEANHGTLAFKSTLDVGTTVTVTLPAAG